MIIIKIMYGLAMIGFGITILKYRRQVKSWTGSFVWAEQYIGRGGTYLVIIIAGLALIFFGTLYPFGGIQLLLK